MSNINVEIRIADEDSIKPREISDGTKIIDLLKDLETNPETVVVKRNGIVVPEEEELSDNDEIEVIPVVSGG